jgi:hypothetical protein
MGTLDESSANAGITVILALVDGGTVELQEADNTEVATLTLSNPAQAGAAAAGVATFDTITEDASCAGGGPITKAVFKTSGSAARFKATVAESGAEIDIDNDSPPAGVQVFITELTAALPVGAVP